MSGSWTSRILGLICYSLLSLKFVVGISALISCLRYNVSQHFCDMLIDKMQEWKWNKLWWSNTWWYAAQPLDTRGRRLGWSRGSVLAFGTQVRGFKPGPSRWIFKGEKILSTPSFGGEVKPSVPCCRFAACKRSLNVPWKTCILGKIVGHVSRVRSSTFRRQGLSGSTDEEADWWQKWERLETLGWHNKSIRLRCICGVCPGPWWKKKKKTHEAIAEVARHDRLGCIDSFQSSFLTTVCWTFHGILTS